MKMQEAIDRHIWTGDQVLEAISEKNDNTTDEEWTEALSAGDLDSIAPFVVVTWPDHVHGRPICVHDAFFAPCQTMEEAKELVECTFEIDVEEAAE